MFGMLWLTTHQCKDDNRWLFRMIHVANTLNYSREWMMSLVAVENRSNGIQWSIPILWHWNMPTKLWNSSISWLNNELWVCVWLTVLVMWFQIPYVSSDTFQSFFSPREIPNLQRISNMCNFTCQRTMDNCSDCEFCIFSDQTKVNTIILRLSSPQPFVRMTFVRHCLFSLLAWPKWHFTFQRCVRFSVSHRNAINSCQTCMSRSAFSYPASLTFQ